MVCRPLLARCRLLAAAASISLALVSPEPGAGSSAAAGPPEPEGGIARTGLIVVGTDRGVAAQVKVFDQLGGLQNNFLPYGAGFSGGVRVAVGDVNGDGRPDVITGPGAGMGPRVRLFDIGPNGPTMLTEFDAYGRAYRKGVFVAAGDVNGDGPAEIITGPGRDLRPNIHAYMGVQHQLTANFLGVGDGSRNGLMVAGGDVNGDGIDDFLCARGMGTPPVVRLFDGPSQGRIGSFEAYGTAFRGGVFVAAGDVNGDGFADIVTGAGPGAGPLVKVFSGMTGQTLASFFAFDPAFAGGVRVAAGDVNGDGFADIITGIGPGGPPQVKVFDGLNGQPFLDFLAFDAGYMGGVFVGATAIPLVAAPGR